MEQERDLSLAIRIQYVDDDDNNKELLEQFRQKKYFNGWIEQQQDSAQTGVFS